VTTPGSTAAPAPVRGTNRPVTSGAAFALGAGGRLLPLAVPMRFFASAAVFQFVAWLALGLGAAQVPRFAGGIGWPLAALHAVTLGMLAMSAIGASLQMMPVATLQPLRWRGAPMWVWWLYMPGVAGLVAGMGLQRTDVIALAAVPVVVALALYGVLLARNLVGARAMPGVRAMGWLALISLALALASASALVMVWAGWAVGSRQGWLMLHIVAAVFGFMGLLALGLSNILVPMFALGPVASDRTQLGVALSAAAALLLALPVAFDLWPLPALLAAIACAVVGSVVHRRSMRRVMRSGMRRELGGSFRLVRLGWAAMFVTWALAAWWALDAARPGLVTALLVCAVLGWLASFLLGILQRIVPFLVSMHGAGAGRRAPTPASLTDERALAVHRFGHAAALGLLGVGLVTGHELPVKLAALSGTVGALAFLRFMASAWMRRSRAIHCRGSSPPR
jgi:hypothetical protein